MTSLSVRGLVTIKVDLSLDLQSKPPADEQKSLALRIKYLSNPPISQYCPLTFLNLLQEGRHMISRSFDVPDKKSSLPFKLGIYLFAPQSTKRYTCLKGLKSIKCQPNTKSSARTNALSLEAIIQWPTITCPRFSHKQTREEQKEANLDRTAYWKQVSRDLFEIATS